MSVSGTFIWFFIELWEPIFDFQFFFVFVWYFIQKVPYETKSSKQHAKLGEIFWKSRFFCREKMKIKNLLPQFDKESCQRLKNNKIKIKFSLVSCSSEKNVLHNFPECGRFWWKIIGNQWFSVMCGLVHGDGGKALHGLRDARESAQQGF